MNEKEIDKLVWISCLIVSLGYSFSIVSAFIFYFIFEEIYVSLTFIITIIVFMNLAIPYELYKLKKKK